jgi:hypothetical protein
MGQQGRRLQSSKNDYRAVASHRSKHAARDLKAREGITGFLCPPGVPGFFIFSHSRLE